MTAWMLSRRITAAAIALVAVAGGAAVASGPSTGTVERATLPPKIISIAPQGVQATTTTANGPMFDSVGLDEMRVGFVVPPDRTGTKKLKMRVVYLENSAAACSWTAHASGLAGPDGPNSEPNVHNGGWLVPGSTSFDGTVSVPAGAGSAHTAIFRWGFPAEPGMFIQFRLMRNGSTAEDSCGVIEVVGLEVRY
jgi:hypothetical protein